MSFKGNISVFKIQLIRFFENILSLILYIMTLSLKKLWTDYGFNAIIIIAVAIFLSWFANYLTSKGSYGMERMSDDSKNPAYMNAPTSAPPAGNPNTMGSGRPSGPRPSEPLGQNEVFSSVSGVSGTPQPMANACSKQNIQNPADLLPKDNNNEWARLNPSGQGELANINLLKAGYNIGIDTIGSSLRNANLQERSEPPNPQLNVGIWNQSTISPDFLRVPLEIGSGMQ